MRFKTSLKSAHALIDLTPLVDVVFLMLVFFIVTSDILPLKSLHIESPRLERDSEPLTTQILVVMDAQHVIYVGSKKTIVDLGSLPETIDRESQILKTQHAKIQPTIVLSLDRRIDYETFLRLFALVQEKTPRVRLVYQPSESDQERL